MLAVLCLLALALPAAAEPRFPELTGRVVDGAGLLSPAKEAEISARLEALERDTTDQVVVVTVDDLQGYAIEEYGYQLGRTWGIGQAGRNNGVLLLVAPNERKVRIEVGYGLEPVLTDALSTLIIHNQILPAFRDGYFERGIDEGVTAIEGQLRLDPAEAQARAAAAETPEAGAPIGPLIFIAAIFLFMALSLVGGIAGRGRRRRGHGVAPILIWAASEAMRSGSRGGSSWGGGGFGGGFGGGGGSFGGGGASGGW
ncbi:YgcG family protein [Brevundimonas sp.]|uniref:TPM domain-containing protein n=1 Tax=Brevundimonas sp. TaxID=1871086 RepID=UPI0035B440A4